ncbi:hypothetical protein GCM10007973_19460 [Polymorphobacter multimanifer]|uniref:Uncharacterized small protein (DUF1192 family) n=1 Tax=Polymorphobacter multimanifer TaxID=1070431 RepID=A0A841LBP3_9SPHN|nr:hypothetical protein [Polymorphobacter multimanifer]MBB6229101.1 uncharacterized small protein (DUF1192 family) [Polymorphobacter multimanifer]GGI83066.1 hypothetical protein GCM10007973_19460 [Polymorphobacter multimanifer]
MSKQDPLIESLMALAVSAAPLIRRARESGMFRNDTAAAKAAEETVEVTVIKPEPAPAPAPEPQPSAEVGALQGLLVRQAMRIAELEAEVAALKARRAAKPAPRKKAKPSRAKADQ